MRSVFLVLILSALALVACKRTYGRHGPFEPPGAGVANPQPQTSQTSRDAGADASLGPPPAVGPMQSEAGGFPIGP